MLLVKLARLAYILYSILSDINIFYPLEVVGRGSETKHQVGKNSFFMIAFCSALGFIRFAYVIISKILDTIYVGEVII